MNMTKMRARTHTRTSGKVTSFLRVTSIVGFEWERQDGRILNREK